MTTLPDPPKDTAWRPIDYFETSYLAIKKAAAKGFELTPKQNGAVLMGTPAGHYLWLSSVWAQIVAVRSYRSTSGTYDDLIPGYRLDNVINLETPEIPERSKEFVAINYKRIPDNDLTNQQVLDARPDWDFEKLGAPAKYPGYL